MRVARQRHQDLAMALRDLGEIVGLRGAETLERQKRFLQQLDQLTRSIEFLASKPGPWLGGGQRGCLAGSELDKVHAEALELARKPAASRWRARAAAPVRVRPVRSA